MFLYLQVSNTEQRYKQLAAAFLLSLLLCACSAQTPPPPEDLAGQTAADATQAPWLALDSPDGERRLFESTARQDFLPLSRYFVTQQNLAYCGAASMTMVLNALHLPMPTAAEYPGYPLFTQNNVFNAATERVLSADTVARQGMTLEQLGKLLATYAVTTRVYSASDSSLEEFRRLAAENLRQPGNFVLVNYLRKTLGQKTGGHISPLAAYHEASDSFLILDVARFKYPPAWVGAAQLWQAMRTIDDASGKTRGFVLVSRPAKAQ